MWRFKTILLTMYRCKKRKQFSLINNKHRGLICREKKQWVHRRINNKGGCHLGCRHASSAISSFKLLLILYICADSYSFTKDSSLSYHQFSSFLSTNLLISHMKIQIDNPLASAESEITASVVFVIRLVMGKARELSISDLYTRKR